MDQIAKAPVMFQGRQVVGFGVARVRRRVLQLRSEREFSRGRDADGRPRGGSEPRERGHHLIAALEERPSVGEHEYGLASFARGAQEHHEIFEAGEHLTVANEPGQRGLTR